MRMTYEAAVERYGHVNLDNSTWHKEGLWMSVITLPDDLDFPNWINIFTKKPVKKLYCNVDMAPALFAALYNVRDRGLSAELKTFNGLFHIRSVRGHKGRVSTHAYGLAIDINAEENPLGGPVVLSKEFAKCFQDAGFTWGADFTRKDGQHFSWAWE